MQLRNPYVTFVYDAFEFRDTFYIITERCSGPVSALFALKPFEGMAWLMPIARCLLQAVHYLHLNNYVQRNRGSGIHFSHSGYFRSAVASNSKAVCGAHPTAAAPRGTLADTRPASAWNSRFVGPHGDGPQPSHGYDGNSHEWRSVKPPSPVFSRLFADWSPAWPKLLVSTISLWLRCPRNYGRLPLLLRHS
jgi:hypothetical protein